VGHDGLVARGMDPARMLLPLAQTWSRAAWT